MSSIRYYLKQSSLNNNHKLYLFCFFLIFTVSFFLRFVNYENRWGLAYDQAHDALVARHAIDARKIPLVGPFSSAGPFQTGGEWYWIIMLGTLFNPYSVLTPWVFMTCLYVIFVLAIMIFSKDLVDKNFSLIVGAIVAVSPAQITQGTNLTNQTPMAFFSLACLWCAVQFLRTKKIRYMFFLSLSVGCAASIHLQGVALLSTLFFTVLFSGVPKTQEMVVILFGLIIPWMPVLIVDIQNNFSNIRNMIQYYVHDQYKIPLEVLGRRWLTYGGIFWPNVWGFVAGGSLLFGYFFIGSTIFVSFLQTMKKNISKEWLVVLLSFLSMMTVLRYTRTPIFESYIVFLHPFIFLITGWVIYHLFQKQRIAGILVLAVCIISSLYRDIEEIKKATNSTAPLMKQWRDEVTSKIYRPEYAVYDYKYQTAGKSLAFVLFLHEQRRVSNSGYKIGIMKHEQSNTNGFQIAEITSMGGVTFVDLNDLQKTEIEKQGWALVTPEEVYRTTEEWYK